MTVKDNLTVSGFDFDATNPLQSQLPQGAATINPATGQPLHLEGGLLFANRGGPKSPYKNDWNNIQPRIGFTYRLNDWLVGARQLRPLVPRTVERRTERRLHHRLPADDAVHRAQRRTASIRERRGRTRFPAGFLQPLAGELGLLTAIGTGPHDPESRLRDSLHRSVDGGRRRPAAVEHRARRRLRRQPGQQARRHAQRQLVPKSENDKAIPSLGGNTGYLNVTFPNPFAGLVPGQGLNAAHRVARAAAAPVSAVHRASR